MFCTAFLEKSLFDFIVITDTHYMRVPAGAALEFGNHAKQAARTKVALHLAADLRDRLGTAFVLHLGDKCQAYPGTEAFHTAMNEAVAQMRDAGLEAMRHVAGNQDVGDKPDPTMPTEPVSRERLDWYHAKFGPSWYSFVHQDAVFIVLNSMLLNSPLPDARRQQEWLENEFPKHHGKRIFLFSHIPLYLWEEREFALGHYENIDEPARSRLLELIREYSVEAVLCGHVHYSFFDHIDRTRFFILCSPSFTRTGFPYVMSSAPPPLRGRDDTPKMGFYLFRVFPGRHDVHFIRTNGAETPPSTRYLVTRVSFGCTDSPLGITFRAPPTPFGEVPISWPSSIREKIRNDYPLMLSLEMGVKHARLPVSDFLDPFQRHRVSIARKEGMAATAMLLWPNPMILDELVGAHEDAFDQLEIIDTGSVEPAPEFLRDLKAIRGHYRGPLALSTIQRGIRIAGKGFPQHRNGYLPEEIEALNRSLAGEDITMNRLLCCVPREEPPWEYIQNIPKALSHIRNIDFIAELGSTDDTVNAIRVAESFFAVFLRGNSRIFFDPLTDMDRSMDEAHGILDTLCNPRSAFHVLRSLNTVLAGFGPGPFESEFQITDAARIVSVSRGDRWCKLVLATNPSAAEPTPVPAIAAGGKPVSRIRLMDGTVDSADPVESLPPVSANEPLLFHSHSI